MSSSPPKITNSSDLEASVDPLLSKRPSREIPIYSKAALRNSAQLVTLFAGDGTEKLVVHKDFACHYSPVLRAAFNSEFLEGRTQEYRLEDTTEDAIRQLINWFYTQNLDINTVGPDGNFGKDDVDRTLKRKEDNTQVELWVLAEKLLIPKLQNLVIREMQRVRKQSCIASGAYVLAYEKTQDGSALRRYLAASCATSAWVKKSIEKYPKQMLMDMFVLLQGTLTESSTKKVKAEYHMADFEVPED